MISVNIKRLVPCLLLLWVSGCAHKPTIAKIDSAYITPKTIPKSTYAASSPILTGDYASSWRLKRFIHHLVSTHGFNEDYLIRLFSQAHRLDYVIRLETKNHYSGPKSAKPRLGGWTRYRKKFIDEAHISKGIQFWSINAKAIQQASEAYAVDPEYIVAIIGIETFFGRNMGNTCTLDALTTLAFDTERRADFFQRELENFLLMTREENYDPLELVGSWAGAMGLGQFMPSSFRRLAVDFNEDGQRNLWHQNDAIGSVANYFSRHGWAFQHPVVTPGNEFGAYPSITLGLHNGYEYWQTHPNFKVIKKYNNSTHYAMAVHQLAQAIKQRYYQ